jgi:hypothetical protein
MSSSLIAPYLIYQPFGVDASNPTYINLPIPQPDQTGITINAASFTTGFPPNTMTPEVSGGLPFFGQDMNGILYMITAYCANFAAGALSSYNATLSSNLSGYPVGVILVNANGNGLWFNQVSGNTTDPDTGGAGWLPVGGVGATSVALAGSNVTLSALQSALPFLSFTGTLSANINVILPANAGQQWVASNACTGAFTVTLKTASGTGVGVPATGASAPTSLYCDGTNIQNTGVSTAGLAPINSPALTGTPTAPTASPATTNTTQIATTAFVQAALTAALSIYAKLASPVFSGSPTAPTPPLTDSSLRLATTAFVQNLLGVSGIVGAVNGGINFLFAGVSIQFRWGQVSQTVAGVQAHSFSTPFTTGCYVVLPVVASSTGVEFFTVTTPAPTASGWNQYSNNTTTINYFAVGH